MVSFTDELLESSCGVFSTFQRGCRHPHPRTLWEALNSLEREIRQCFTHPPHEGIYNIFVMTDRLEEDPDLLTELPYYGCSDKMEEDRDYCSVCFRGHYLEFDALPSDLGRFLRAVQVMRASWIRETFDESDVAGEV